MEVELWVGVVVLCAGVFYWIGTKAWADGDQLSLLPTYLMQHGGRVILGLLLTAVAFLGDVVYSGKPITATQLLAIFLMASGGQSILNHTKGGNKK